MMNYTPEAFKEIVLQKLAGKMKSRTALAIAFIKIPKTMRQKGKIFIWHAYGKLKMTISGPGMIPYALHIPGASCRMRYRSIWFSSSAAKRIYHVWWGHIYRRHWVNIGLMIGLIKA